jgi:hypothetical protein
MTDPLYGQAHYASRPTPRTLFFRTFFPWQVLRFVFVNLRMTVMILKSHDSRVTRRQLPP